MRLPGRIAAGIEVLAEIENRHRPPGEALRDWGNAHRFAGAGDRAVIGNLVYDALRRRASIGWRVGGETPWHLAVGAAIFVWDLDPRELSESFCEDRYAPSPIPPDLIERIKSADLAAAPEHVRAEVPAWIAPYLEAGLGAGWVAEGEALAGRPPLDLRVNTLKSDREKAIRQLARLGAEPTPFSPVGLRIPPVEGARRHPHVQAEEVFQRGRVEVQDEGSQLCALLVGAAPGEQVLDYCAGSGGKTLALAACMENRGQIYAYDQDRNRLAPIFERLRRAGVRNAQVRSPAPGVLDDIVGSMARVLVDAPCTGTGTWRRRPDAKWRVTPEALQKRVAEQQTILADAAVYVRPGGVLTYTTCSVLLAEGEERVAAFLAIRPDFRPLPMRDVWAASMPKVAPPAEALTDVSLLLTPRRTGTDGFFCSAMRRAG
jgi:16S rRNA (cytosine967-C5)-methyltransferase